MTLILILIVSVISIPKIQTKIGRIVTDKINNQFKTNISVEKVNISLFGDINLKNIKILDHHSDTLIFSKQLSTSLLSLKKIIDGDLNLSDVELETLKLHMKWYKGEADDNLNVFIDSFLTDTISSEKPFVLKAKNIYVKNLDYELLDYDSKNPIIFTAKKGGGHIKNLNIKGIDITADINNLYFTENNGVRIKKLNTRYVMSKDKIQFLKTQIRTNNNSIIRGNIGFYTKTEFSNFIATTKINAQIRNSQFSTYDLKKLYKEFGKDINLSLNTNIYGTLNNLIFKHFSTQSDNDLKAKGNLQLINTFSNEGFEFLGDMNIISANFDQIQKLLPNIVKKEYRNKIAPFGKINIDGLIDITPKQKNANLNIRTSSGGKISNLILRNITDNQKARYSGYLDFREFDLGCFLNNENIGKITLAANFKGNGYNLNTSKSTLIGSVESIELNNYKYKNIKINGALNNKKFDGLIDINDQNVKLNFEGLADFSKKTPVFDFDVDIDKFDLKKTNIFVRDSIAQVSGNIQVDAVGANLDDIVGSGNFKNFNYCSPKKNYTFKNFSFSSKVQDSIRTIDVNSDAIIKGSLNGKFLFKELIPLTKNTLLSNYTNYEKIPVTPNQYINFDFKIYSDIVEIFMKDFSLGSNAHIKGKINANKNSVKLVATTHKIKAKDIIIDSLQLRINNKNKLYHTYISAKEIKNKKYNLCGLSVINRTKNDTLYFKSQFKGGPKKTEEYNIDFFYTYNQEKKSIIGVKNSSLYIKNCLWRINPYKDNLNYIAYDNTNKSFEIAPFTIKAQNQTATLYGSYSEKDKNLNASLNNIDISNLIPEIEDLKLAGTLNGSFNLLQNKDKTSSKADFTIEDFMINDISHGAVKAKIKNIDSLNKYYIDLSLKDYLEENIKTKGTIDFGPKTPLVNLEVALKDYELDGYSKLGGDIISNIRGLLSGKFNAKGPLTAPDINGWLSLNKAGMAFPYLNVDLAFSDDTWIKLEHNSFLLTNIIYDTKYNTQAELSGKIFHHGFSEWYMDLAIRSSNLLVLDTKESEEPYYGTGFLDGVALISGNATNLTIDVSGQTEKGTVFIMPLSDVTMADDNKLISFVKKKQKTATKNKNLIEKETGLTVLMNLDITEDAQAKFVIDKVNKSDLQGRGTGNLEIDINTNGKFTINGNLIIDKGIYNFRYAGIPKKFKLLSGGTISWNGDPMEAALDLTAKYEAKANPSQLLENIISNRKIPIDLYTRITGDLFDSKQEFDIKIPNADAAVSSELEFMFENDANSKMLNFVSLLLGNTFYINQANGSNFASNLVTSTASDVFSNILSNIINTGDSKLQLNVGYTQADRNDLEGLTYDNQVDLSVKGQLTDRIIFNGKLGVPIGTSNMESNIIGEAKLEVLLNKSGNLRWNIFNKPNDIQYSIEEQGYTQGTGVSYQVSFNTVNELFQKITGKNKKKSIKTNTKSDEKK